MKNLCTLFQAHFHEVPGFIAFQLSSPTIGMPLTLEGEVRALLKELFKDTEHSIIAKVLRFKFRILQGFESPTSAPFIPAHRFDRPGRIPRKISQILTKVRRRSTSRP